MTTGTIELVPKLPQPKSPPVIQDADKLAQETVVLQLEISTPSFQTKIDSATVVQEEGLDSTYIHASKDLIDTTRNEYRAITQHASRFKTRWLKNRTVPCSMLKAGMALVPLANLEEIDRGIQQFILERKELVKAFAAVFEKCKEEAKGRLGSHYDVSDYPDPEQLWGKFTVKARFWGFNVPAAIEKVNKEIWQREKARVELELKGAAEEIQQALREAFGGLVEHLVDRLTPDDDGKPKSFRDSPIVNLKDFLDTFASRNLTRDDELAGLVAKARALMSGVKPEALRKQDTTRDRVKAGFAEIKAALNPLIIKKTREFSLED